MSDNVLVGLDKRECILIERSLLRYRKKVVSQTDPNFVPAPGKRDSNKSQLEAIDSSLAKIQDAKAHWNVEGRIKG